MTKYYPLSYAQNAIWNIEKFAPNTSINVIAGTLRFEEKLDFRLLEEGFNLMLKKQWYSASVPDPKWRTCPI